MSRPIMVTRNGQTLSLRGWAKQVGIGWPTVESRLKAGWSLEKALTTPVQLHRGQHWKHKLAGTLPAVRVPIGATSFAGFGVESPHIHTEGSEARGLASDDGERL